MGNGLFLINNNQFITSLTDPLGAVPLGILFNAGNFSKLVISGNTFEGNYESAIEALANPGSIYDMEITRNIFTHANGLGSIVFTTFGSGQATISQNILNHNTPAMLLPNAGIVIDQASPQNSCITIQGNQISTITDEGIYISTEASTATINIIIADNVITTTGAEANGVVATTAAASTLCLNLLNNTATVALTSFGYQIAPSSSVGTINLEPIVGNIGTFAPTMGSVIIVPAGTCNCDQ